MKRNLFSYVSIVLLVLFAGILSVQNTAAANKQSAFSSNVKSLTSVQKPGDNTNTEDQSFFEKETEDESETEFNAALPRVNLSEQLNHLLLIKIISYNPSLTEDFIDTEQPLYLSICAFRI